MEEADKSLASNPSEPENQQGIQYTDFLLVLFYLFFIEKQNIQPSSGDSIKPQEEENAQTTKGLPLNPEIEPAKNLIEPPIIEQLESSKETEAPLECINLPEESKNITDSTEKAPVITESVEDANCKKEISTIEAKSAGETFSEGVVPQTATVVVEEPKIPEETVSDKENLQEAMDEDEKNQAIEEISQIEPKKEVVEDEVLIKKEVIVLDNNKRGLEIFNFLL